MLPFLQHYDPLMPLTSCTTCNMQQNCRNHAKLLPEFQFHIQPKIRRKQVSHKSATKIFIQSNIRIAVKNLAVGSSGTYRTFRILLPQYYHENYYHYRHYRCI